MHTIDLYSDLSNLDPVIRESLRILENKGVIVYPTDTVYGFGADAENQAAVSRIREIKGREDKKPFSVIMRDFEMIKQYAYVNKKIEKIIETILPGRFTFIFLSKGKLKSIEHESQTIGIRIPDCKYTLGLSRKFKNPYVSTSVNDVGEEPMTVGIDIKLKYEERAKKPDLLVDAGRIGERGEKPKPSTIIDLSAKKPTIIRNGGLGVKDILELLRKLEEVT